MAIAAIAFMVRWLKPGAAPPLTADGALDLYRVEFPSDAATVAQISADGGTAVVSAADGVVLGCVTLIGLRWTARRIGPQDLSSVTAKGTQTILRFRDFTWPSLRATWPDAPAARGWARTLRRQKDD